MGQDGADRFGRIGYNSRLVPPAAGGAISNQTQPKFAERLVEKPDPQDTFSSLDNPFGFTMHNVIWLGGTAAVVVMLIVLRTMGVLH
jgi:hypothetical protein